MKSRKTYFYLGQIAVAVLILFTVNSSHVKAWDWRNAKSCLDLLVGLPSLGPILSWPSQVINPHNKLSVLESVGLSGRGPVSHARAEEIFVQIQNSESVMRRLIRSAIIEPLGGLESPDLWDFYLGGAYEKITTRVPEYLKIFVRMSEDLPQAGTIADLGSGTAVGSGIIGALGPKRFMVAIERSAVGIERSRSRLRTLRPNLSSSFGMDLAQLNFTNMWDAAVANNVVYALSRKREFFRNVYAALVPGGVFILNDPMIRVAMPDVKVEMQKKIILSALENGSDITEQDIAFVMALNLEVLMKPENFYNSVEMKDALESVGFKVERREFTYFVSCMYIVARKPIIQADE